MKPGRLPSIGITRLLRYYSPLRLLPCSAQISVALIPSRCGHHPQQGRSPALPSVTSLSCRPDDPGKSTCFCSVCSAVGCGLPHLTTGSALSKTSYEALWVPWWYGLRVCDPFLKKVFSFRLVLKVASHHWIFASGMYRQFPAPDFNRLATLLPRRTVKS